MCGVSGADCSFLSGAQRTRRCSWSSSWERCSADSILTRIFTGRCDESGRGSPPPMFEAVAGRGAWL